MLKLETEIILYLERLKIIFLNKMIVVECIKDCDRINLFSENIGPFKRGRTYKLPFWKIKPFFERNYCKIQSKNEINSSLIQQFAENERDNTKLVKRQNNFFVEIKELKRLIKNKIENKIYPKEELIKFQLHLESLLHQRISKIEKLATSTPSIEIMGRLTDTEKILFEGFRSLIKDFKEFLLD